MLFKDIIGQKDIKQHLIQSVIGNRVSHAQLFAGKPGYGGLPLAIAYAQFICCTHRQANDSCGECPSCKKFMKLAHPDLHFVFPVVKANSSTNPISDTFINEWRTRCNESPYFNINQWYDAIGVEKQGMIYAAESGEIVRKLSLKSFESEYKVMIIWMPEFMNETAANKLLKMIEEPPHKTLFLLVSETPAEIISTILSRTQLLKIPPIEKNEIEKVLIEKYNQPAVDAQSQAHVANGDWLTAMELIQRSDEIVFYLENFKTLFRLCFGKKIVELFDWIENMSKQSRENQKAFIDYTIHQLRENFIMNQNQPELVYMLPDEMEFSKKFAPFINEKNIFALIDELSLAYAHLEQNGSSKIVIADMVFKILIIFKQQ